MKYGEYQVYKLYSEKTNDEVTEFFLPDGRTNKIELKRMVNRHQVLRDYTKKGYVVTSIHYVDKETYLNLRINETVKEICDTLNYREKVKAQYRDREITKNTYTQTMKMYKDSIETLLRKLDFQVRRIHNEGFDCDNELAVELYNSFTSKSVFFLD